MQIVFKLFFFFKTLCKNTFCPLDDGHKDYEHEHGREENRDKDKTLETDYAHVVLRNILRDFSTPMIGSSLGSSPSLPSRRSG